MRSPRLQNLNDGHLEALRFEYLALDIVKSATTNPVQLFAYKDPCGTHTQPNAHGRDQYLIGAQLTRNNESHFSAPYLSPSSVQLCQARCNLPGSCGS